MNYEEFNEGKMKILFVHLSDAQIEENTKEADIDESWHDSVF